MRTVPQGSEGCGGPPGRAVHPRVRACSADGPRSKTQRSRTLRGKPPAAILPPVPCRKAPCRWPLQKPGSPPRRRRCNDPLSFYGASSTTPSAGHVLRPVPLQRSADSRGHCYGATGRGVDAPWTSDTPWDGTRPPAQFRPNACASRAQNGQLTVPAPRTPANTPTAESVPPRRAPQASTVSAASHARTRQRGRAPQLGAYCLRTEGLCAADQPPRMPQRARPPAHRRARCLPCARACPTAVHGRARTQRRCALRVGGADVPGSRRAAAGGCGKKHKAAPRGSRVRGRSSRRQAQMGDEMRGRCVRFVRRPVRVRFAAPPVAALYMRAVDGRLLEAWAMFPTPPKLYTASPLSRSVLWFWFARSPTANCAATGLEGEPNLEAIPFVWVTLKFWRRLIAIEFSLSRNVRNDCVWCPPSACRFPNAIRCAAPFGAAAHRCSHRSRQLQMLVRGPDNSYWEPARAY